MKIVSKKLETFKEKVESNRSVMKSFSVALDSGILGFSISDIFEIELLWGGPWYRPDQSKILHNL